MLLSTPRRASLLDVPLTPDPRFFLGAAVNILKSKENSSPIFASEKMSPPHQSRLSGGGAWVDPFSLPNHGSAADIAGNASDQVKQLTSNVLWSYGVGQKDGFAYDVCRRIKILEINIEEKNGRTMVTIVHEIEVFEGEDRGMLLMIVCTD